MLIKKITVLIPDGECYHLINVVNCLAQKSDIKIVIMSNKKTIAMRFSRHIHNFSYYPEAENEFAWVYNINRELIKFNIDLILPISESGIRTLIKYRDKISDFNKLCVLPNLECFDTIINKWKLAKHLKKNNLPGPKTEFISSWTIHSLKQSELSLPVIIKPIQGFGGGHGIKVFQNFDDLISHFESLKSEIKFIAQEYIEGYDIDCSVLCKEGIIKAFTIQKGNMIGKNAFSPQLGLELLYNKKIIKIVDSLMDSLNWSGIAHIDMRYDSNKEIFQIIEVNPRYWISLDASLLAGVNFPYLQTLISLNKKFEKPVYRHINYFNLKGIIKSILRGNLNTLKPSFLWNNTQLKFAICDPLPMIFKYFSRTKNIILARISRLFLLSSLFLIC